MFRTDTMPRSYNPALEQRERRFDGVGRHHEIMLVPDILFRRVIDGFVLLLQFAKSLRIGRKVIGHDDINVVRDVLLDVPRQSSTLSILSVKETKIAAALTDADDDFFLVALTAPALTVAVLLAAYIGFVHLNS